MVSSERFGCFLITMAHSSHHYKGLSNLWKAWVKNQHCRAMVRMLSISFVRQKGLRTCCMLLAFKPTLWKCNYLPSIQIQTEFQKYWFLGSRRCRYSQNMRMFISTKISIVCYVLNESWRLRKTRHPWSSVVTEEKWYITKGHHIFSLSWRLWMRSATTCWESDEFWTERLAGGTEFELGLWRAVHTQVSHTPRNQREESILESDLVWLYGEKRIDLGKLLVYHNVLLH